jgi:sulfopyruvate decarboxylase subunit alpha
VGVDTEEVMNLAEAKLSGDKIIQAVKDGGINTILSVPDRTTEKGLLRRISEDPMLRNVRVAKEDETVGISAGLSYSGTRALCLFQYTGLLDSLNAIRAIAMEYSMPICMMVGLLGKKPGVPPTESENYGIRIIEPVLDAMEVPHLLLETDADLPLVSPAIERAYETSTPIAFLIGRSPS